VQAPQYPLAGTAVVVLDEVRRYAASGKLFGMPCFHEKPAVVTEYFGFDKYDIR
jgi:hypothetical protein